jgi:Ribosome 60S biogenesis N-terminal
MTGVSCGAAGCLHFWEREIYPCCFMQAPGSCEPGFAAVCGPLMSTRCGIHAGKRMKPLYFNLGCDARPRANASLALLAAVARRGSGVARELVDAFDFDLKALAKLSRPPRWAASPQRGGAS